MEKLEIYNKALDLCGQQPLEAEDLEKEEKDQTVKTLDTWYPTALRKASRELSWPFLEVQLQLGEDEGAGHGYEHSYPCPDDTEALTWAQGDEYQRIGNKLFTNGEGEAWGIRKDIMPDSVPDDFYDLVAIALAYYASVRLSPDTNTRNAIYYLYQDRRDELMDHYLQAERRHGYQDSIC